MTAGGCSVSGIEKKKNVNIKQSKYIKVAISHQCESVDNLKIENFSTLPSKDTMLFATCSDCLTTFTDTDKIPKSHIHSSKKRNIQTAVNIKTRMDPSIQQLLSVYASKKGYKENKQPLVNQKEKLTKTSSTNISIKTTLKKRNWLSSHACPCCKRSYPFKQSLIEHMNSIHPTEAI